MHTYSGVLARHAGYAKPILDVLDPTGNLFAARLYRDATTTTLHHSNVKVRSSRCCAFPAASWCHSRHWVPMMCAPCGVWLWPAYITHLCTFCHNSLHTSQPCLTLVVSMQDLSLLKCDLARTVLVDDSPFSFLMQPSNGLPIRPFTGQPSDQDLLTVRSLSASACTAWVAVWARQHRMCLWRRRRHDRGHHGHVTNHHGACQVTPGVCCS